jgi:hypothetical protein
LVAVTAPATLDPAWFPDPPPIEVNRREPKFAAAVADAEPKEVAGEEAPSPKREGTAPMDARRPPAAYSVEYELGKPPEPAEVPPAPTLTM